MNLNVVRSPSVVFVSLLSCLAFGSINCSSDSNDGAGGAAPQAGSNTTSGSGGGGSSAAGAGGAGASAGGMTSKAGSAGVSGGGAATGGGGSGGASAGSSQGGSAGSAAGSGGSGGSTGGSSAGSGGSGGGGTIMLSSSKLAAGAKFADEYTCASTTSHSPPLTWTAGPSGTLSYAIVLEDTTINFNHWVVYDIPPATLMLPESLPTDAALTMPAGAKQKAGQGMGYLGPCPSGMLHTYVFTVYALDVATLPGVTASSATMDLADAVKMHDLASASLSGMSDAKKP